MAATDFDYIDYADAAGQIRRLPVAKGTACSARPAPGTLTPGQIATMVAELPTAPVGYAWQRKGCVLGDGSWYEDNDNPPSFIPDAGSNPGVIVSPTDQAGEELLGFTKTNQPV